MLTTFFFLLQFFSFFFLPQMSRLTLECVTPLEKLLCLKKCHDEINRAVERNLTSRYLDIGAHQMTTDDLLDQLIYAIIKARQRNVRLATARMRREETMRGASFSSSSSSSSSSRNRRNPIGSLGDHAMASSTNRGELLDRMRLLSLKRSFLATNIQWVFFFLPSFSFFAFYFE